MGKGPEGVVDGGGALSVVSTPNLPLLIDHNNLIFPPTGPFTPHADAARHADRSPEDILEIENHLSSLVEKANEITESIELTFEDLQEILPEDIHKKLKEWLILYSEGYLADVPQAIIGHGSFFINIAKMVLAERGVDPVLSHHKQSPPGIADLDLLFTERVPQLHSVEINAATAAKVGAGIISPSKHDLWLTNQWNNPHLPGRKIDSRILRLRHRKLNSIEEMGALNLLQSPNQPWLLFTLDQDRNMVAKVIYQSEPLELKGFLEPFSYELNGTRAVSLMIEHIDAYSRAGNKIPQETLDYMKKQRVQNLLPDMINGAPENVKKIISGNPLEVEDAMRKMGVSDQAVLDQITLYSFSIAKTFSHLMKDFGGDKLELAQLLLEVGILESLIEATRLSGDKYHNIDSLIELVSLINT